MENTFEEHLHQAAAAVGVAHLQPTTPAQTLHNQKLHNLEFLHKYKARLRRDLIPRTICPRIEERERLRRLVNYQPDQGTSRGWGPVPSLWLS